MLNYSQKCVTKRRTMISIRDMNQNTFLVKIIIIVLDPVFGFNYYRYNFKCGSIRIFEVITKPSIKNTEVLEVDKI